MNSVHYIEPCNIVLHISTTAEIDQVRNTKTGGFENKFVSDERIIFEFFDPQTLEKIENKKPFFDLELYDLRKP